MSDLHERIARFENMAAADPANEMAHFSLGGLYAQDGRHADAAAAYMRAIDRNPEMSKAYQLAGEALVADNRRDEAISILQRGFEVAAGKGDMLPKQAIADMLTALGAALPEVAEPAPNAAGSTGTFICSRTGRPGTRLKESPVRGPVGDWIRENISAETWQEWIGQGTKVINELRLDFSREDDQKAYDQHMLEYLGYEGGR